MGFKTRNENTFYIANIFVPLILGAMFYYVCFPNVVFVNYLESLGINNFHWNISGESIGVQFIRNYMLDMLWGYALVFTLNFIHGNNAAKINKVLIIAFAFSAVLEILQLTSFSRGTFDVFDIVAEFFAELIAAFIIRNKFKERNDEK